MSAAETLATPGGGPCSCGCGRQTKPGRRFLKGHKGRCRSRVILGARFGTVTVVGDLGYRMEPNGKRRRAWWTVRCDCGAEYGACGIYLLREETPRCRKCKIAALRITKIGQRFDKLTVVGYEHANARPLVVCRCDCGVIVKQRAELLHKNKTSNCGCDARGGYEGFEGLSKTIYGRMLRNAANRDLTVEVTIQFLWELYLRQGGRCALSGTPISLSKKSAVASQASVDRIDSDRGYTEDNVQWVHKDINLMKLDLDQARFFELCEMVTGNRAASVLPKAPDIERIDQELVEIVSEAIR
jgi:hypothetical protein